SAIGITSCVLDIDLVVGRDFTADGTIEAADVRPGDDCPSCGHGLESARGIEMGHIFQLGTKYAEALDLKVLDEHGKLRTVTMGSYGVGVTRAVACIAEGNHDEFGLVWPRDISPADVHIVATGKDRTRDPEVFDTAERLTRELEAEGLEVLYDDREKVSPGVKFKDSELIGVPTILVIGKSLENGLVEIKDRRSGDRAEVPVVDAVSAVIAAVSGGDR
ncbi:MAG TPA: His/Gly/Thr/Pro-type tRNA ligase C-terminal domain-containing protein, partial [Phycicoccus sp.]|nr:His/Gly/Thr/Pro-type tRNA ligase C-terminal domain-containing protein [Phycicoccus sp.]